MLALSVHLRLPTVEASTLALRGAQLLHRPPLSTSHWLCFQGIVFRFRVEVDRILG